MKELLTYGAEIWYQDNSDYDLWHGPQGLIVNTAALEEREAFYEVTRVTNVSASVEANAQACCA